MRLIEPRKPAPARASLPEDRRSLAALLAEWQALSLLLPVTPRSEDEIEASFDNLPV